LVWFRGLVLVQNSKRLAIVAVVAVVPVIVAVIVAVVIASSAVLDAFSKGWNSKRYGIIGDFRVGNMLESAGRKRPNRLQQGSTSIGTEQSV